jgi:hypothetical protein
MSAPATDVRRIAGHIGAEITGIQVGPGLEPDIVSFIRGALHTSSPEGSANPPRISRRPYPSGAPRMSDPPSNFEHDSKRAGLYREPVFE